MRKRATKALAWSLLFLGYVGKVCIYALSCLWLADVYCWAKRECGYDELHESMASELLKWPRRRQR